MKAIISVFKQGEVVEEVETKTNHGITEIGNAIHRYSHDFYLGNIDEIYVRRCSDEIVPENGG